MGTQMLKSFENSDVTERVHYARVWLVVVNAQGPVMTTLGGGPAIQQSVCSVSGIRVKVQRDSDDRTICNFGSGQREPTTNCFIDISSAAVHVNRASLHQDTTEGTCNLLIADKGCCLVRVLKLRKAAETHWQPTRGALQFASSKHWWQLQHTETTWRKHLARWRTHFPWWIHKMFTPPAILSLHLQQFYGSHLFLNYDLAT